MFAYIEIFYNRKRYHLALSYLSPAEFLKLHYQSKV
ncbi:IS3 family transposase [Chlorobium limicola]